MTNEDYGRFIGAIRETFILVNDAIKDNNDFDSSIKWTEVFGDVFPICTSGKSEFTAPYTTKLGVTGHKENLDCKVELDPKRKHVKLFCSYYKGDSFVSNLDSDGPTLLPGLDLKFRGKTKIKQPYDVKWQVVNTGAHAKSIEGGFRGGFFTSRDRTGKAIGSKLENWEQTLYTGKHWIQCFIIKNGVCVAESDRFFVNIFNEEFPDA
jgi:hypothetical protein